MSGYNLAMFVLAFIITTAVWIPLNEVSNSFVDVMNAMPIDFYFTNINTLLGKVFYFSLLFIFIVMVLWLIKPQQNEEVNYG